MKDLPQGRARRERRSRWLDQGERNREHDKRGTRINEERQAQPDRGEQSASHRRNGRAHPGPSLGFTLDARVFCLPALGRQRVEYQRGLGARKEAVAESEDDLRASEQPKTVGQSVRCHTRGHADRAYQQSAATTENVGQIARWHFE